MITIQISLLRREGVLNGIHDRGANILTLAVAVWFLGTIINKKVTLLERYSIPVAVTGGLLCSLVVTDIYYTFDITINFDTRLRDLLLLAFFSTIGLSAKISLLNVGGKALVILLLSPVSGFVRLTAVRLKM